MFAVEPELVKEHAERLTEEELTERVLGQHWKPGMWLTLSGGNPAVHDLGGWVVDIRSRHYRVAVETQGSIWRDWLRHVDHLVVSPKPPSSKMATERHREQTTAFLNRAQRWVRRESRSMKIVVFDQQDLDWARELIKSRRYGSLHMWDTFLSVGTDPPNWNDPELTRTTRQQVVERYRWLCEQVAGDPVFIHTRVLPQLHVLAWGHARGV
jgi:7-carboxy-7-deazaguanine synthase